MQTPKRETTTGVPSRSIHLNDRVKVLELDACGVSCEVPVCLGVVVIAMTHPGGDLVGQDLLVGDASIEALRGQDGQLGFGEIEPRAVLGRVVPFEAFDQAT